MPDSTPSTHPWKVGQEPWYAALVSAGTVYGLARLSGTRALRFDVLDRATGEWVPAPNGAAYFTEIGGITDAEPIDAARAAEVERELLAKPPPA